MQLKFIICFFTLFAFNTYAEIIHSLSAEVRGLYGTGGLQHAVLDKATFIEKAGHNIKIVMPYYTSLDQLELKNIKVIANNLIVHHDQGHSNFMYDVVEFDHPEIPNQKVIAIKHNPGNGYSNIFDNITNNGTKVYSKHPNEGQVFGFFSKAYNQWMDQLNLNKQPDIVILNDWHTGFTAALLEERKDVYVNNIKNNKVNKFSKKVPYIQGVIHNLKYQGVFSPELFGWIGLDLKYFHGTEMYGQTNFLKTLLEYSDYSEAVSKTYSREITTTRFSEGLEDITQRLAREGRLSGLLNGIDPSAWNPNIPNTGLEEYDQFGFSDEDTSNKSLGKKKLINDIFNIDPTDNTKLVALTARIDQQKGFDFLLGQNGTLEKVLANEDLDFKFLVAGDAHGDPNLSPYIQELKRLEAKYPNKIRTFSFSPQRERLFLYFSDFYLGASLFEPSGLAQMFAQSVGTIPIVSNVGGHLDSVKPGESGFIFKLGNGNDETVNNLYNKFKEVEHAYKAQESFRQLRESTMKTNNSWSQRVGSFQQFIELSHFNFFEKGNSFIRSSYLEDSILNMEKAYKFEIDGSKKCYIPFKKALGLRF